MTNAKKPTDKLCSVADALAKEPRVLVIVPPHPGIAPEQDYQPVCINGHITRVRCGLAVEVPKPVAERLRHSVNAMIQSNVAVADMTSGTGRKLSQ